MNRVQLVQHKSGEEFTLNEGANLIGRDPGCDVCIDHQQLSRKHCRIECRGNTAIVRDLNSTNGTFVNGEPATRLVCDPGDELKLGNLRFLVRTVTVPDEPQQAVSNAEKSDDLLAGMDLDQLESAAPPAPIAKVPKKKRRKRRKPDAADILAELNAEDDPAPTPAPQNSNQQEPRDHHPAVAATVPVTQIPASVPAAASMATAPTQTPPAFRPSPKAKVAKQKREREPIDWSSLKTFVEERTGLALTLVVCLLLAAVIFVPWSSFLRSSDETILVFYETALSDVKTSGASKSDLKSQSDAYIEELSDGSQLSIAGRQLLMAGRDYFPEILSGSASDDSAAETLFKERLRAARAFVDGTDPPVPASQMENLEALKNGSMMGEMIPPEEGRKSS